MGGGAIFSGSRRPQRRREARPGGRVLQFQHRVDPAGKRERHLRGGGQLRCRRYRCAILQWLSGTSTATGSWTSRIRTPLPTPCRSCWETGTAPSRRRSLTPSPITRIQWRPGTSTVTESPTSRSGTGSSCRSGWEPGLELSGPRSITAPVVARIQWRSGTSTVTGSPTSRLANGGGTRVDPAGKWERHVRGVGQLPPPVVAAEVQWRSATPTVTESPTSRP